MKHLTILHLAIFYLIANQDLISQNCKFAKDEIDPFTKKEALLTKTFLIANPLTSEARKPTLHGQFGLENDSIYFKLQSVIIVSGGILADTDNLKEYIKFKENDYILIKFENNDNLLKLRFDYQSQVSENRSSGMITLNTFAKFNLSKEDVNQLAKNKLERLRFLKDNENEKIDYEIKNVNHKDNVVSNATCFSVALGRKSK
jgi:hypothetical protein